LAAAVLPAPCLAQGGLKNALLFDDFSQIAGQWKGSEDPMYNGYVSGTEGNLALRDEARRYGASRTLPSPLALGEEPVVLQYEVQFAGGHSCSGGYLKFLSHDGSFESKKMTDQTPYSIMFGPDKCGDAGKLHLIFRYMDKNTGEYEEKHLSQPVKVPTTDQGTHVFTAVINPDNTYKILIDDTVESEGSLFEDFTPPFLPPQEIDDPEDTKPDTWVDEARILDEEAVKPEDWDETIPQYYPDPTATMPDDWNEDLPLEVADPQAEEPEDWDEDEDGEWEVPSIPNPECQAISGCGPWTAPKVSNLDYVGEWKRPYIDNPEYKGEWTPKQIPNPDYFDDDEPLKSVAPVGAVAVEVWVMDKDIVFDNLLISNDEEHSQEAIETFWLPKAEKEKAERAKTLSESNKHSHLAFWRKQIETLIEPFVFEYLPEAGVDVFVDVKEFLLSNLIYLYVVVGLIPTFLVMLCFKCCVRSSEGGARAASDAGARKKTDEATPDDEEEEEEDDGEDNAEEEEEEEEEVVEKKVRKRTTRRTRA
jgi:calnexin